MTPVYAIVLIVGVIGLLVWVAMTAVGETVEGWRGVDPEARFGVRGRFALAAALGFGLAGMSARPKPRATQALRRTSRARR